MCDNGRKKGVTFGGGGGRGFVVLVITTDPRCDKRLLLHEILKDHVNKEGSA